MPKFIDISLENFCIDKTKLLEYVKKNHKKIACIFPTSLIGFCQDMDFFIDLEKTFDIKICFDNCENTLGSFRNKNVSFYFTSTTSTYFGHQIQSVEGGFIFTNSDKEYDYFLMNRNHGMVRSISAYERNSEAYTNKNVDPLFDFYSLGNNFRNSDINAFIGILDLKRFEKYKIVREKLYKVFKSNLDLERFYLPEPRAYQEDIPFCFPIIVKNKNLELINKCKEFCKRLNIEYRPIISGHLGYQTCYKKFFKNEKDYTNSIYIHTYGFYVGLNPKVKEKDVLFLTKKLNNL
jgi:CDP-6-deoxy-D-xylo-4-hexulose-3-dehydrase